MSGVSFTDQEAYERRFGLPSSDKLPGARAQWSGGAFAISPELPVLHATISTLESSDTANFASQLRRSLINVVTTRQSMAPAPLRGRLRHLSIAR